MLETPIGIEPIVRIDCILIGSWMECYMFGTNTEQKVKN